MDQAIHYVTTAVARTGAQLLVVFGVMFALAAVLWFVSQGIRAAAASRMGFAYYYLVAPGVICHETGHALGCILTGTRIVKFVPFAPSSDGTLGYVSRELHLEPRSRCRRTDERRNRVAETMAVFDTVRHGIRAFAGCRLLLRCVCVHPSDRKKTMTMRSCQICFPRLPDIGKGFSVSMFVQIRKELRLS